MKKAFILLLLIVSVAAQAQNVKGKVCLSRDKSPVQFASVALLQLPDSSMVTGGITLTDGGFTLEKIKPGNYFLRASFVGYISGGKRVEITSQKEDIILDTIYLAETTRSLNEVSVVAERLKGKEMVDKTVYSIPQVVAKSSTNGYDILKKIPQVNVDIQNNITLNGSSNFIIQVDGRQRDREFLAKLLPSDIESVEIVSNPSGKYEGNIDGVINIILKKEARYGMSGNVGVTLKPFNKVTSSVSGSLDYSAGKITFYVTGFAFTQSLFINTTNSSRFAAIDSTTSLSGVGKIKVTNPSVNTGFDYYMNDKNNLSFNVSFKPISQNVDVNSETFLYKSNNPLNTLQSLTYNSTKSNETSFSFFYKKSFKKPVQEFTGEANYYIFRATDTKDFTNNRFMYNSDDLLSTYSRLEDNLNKRNYLSVKLNYVQPLGMQAKLEAGYQMYYQTMSYNFTIDDVFANNLFDYNELRNSFYGGVSANLKKFGVQAMLRVENSNITADSVSDKNYTCLLPSFNMQYKFSATHNLKFTYNRRINRPGIYDMNPYFKIGQTYDVSQGNPNLKPDYRDRLQFTYTWNFGSNYFSPYVYTEHFSDRIGRQYSIISSPVNGALTTLTKPYNILNGDEVGGGVNTMLWFVNINARVMSGHYNSYSNLSTFIPARNYFSYSITSYAYAPLGKDKKTTLFMFFNYNGVNVDAQSKTFSLPLYGLGGQKQLKDHSFGIFYLLPFSQNVKLNKTVTETPYYSMTNNIGFNAGYYIQFMYTYKFNKGRNVKKLDHKMEIESDSKSNAIGR